MKDDDVNNHVEGKVIPNLELFDCLSTTVSFEDKVFVLSYCNSEIRVALDESNYAVVTLRNQKVLDEEKELGGMALSVHKTGDIDYKKYFTVVWSEEFAVPELAFFKAPKDVTRKYLKGQRIELGIEDVPQYHVEYQDGVTANFTRKAPGQYEFTFSTGFTGSFKKEKDGSHSIWFKGLPMEADEGVYTSESKFIISRSKYTNNMVLIMQENATVSLRTV